MNWDAILNFFSKGMLKKAVHFKSNSNCKGHHIIFTSYYICFCCIHHLMMYVNSPILCYFDCSTMWIRVFQINQTPEWNLWFIFVYHDDEIL